jgi:hypothetical protein
LLWSWVWQNHEHGDIDQAARIRKRGGFGEGQMKTVFDNAGVGMDFGFDIIAKGATFEIGKHSMAKDVSMARGKRHKGESS